MMISGNAPELIRVRNGASTGLRLEERTLAIRRQLLTGLLATGRRGCVTTGPAATIAQYATGRLGTTLGGQLA